MLRSTLVSMALCLALAAAPAHAQWQSPAAQQEPTLIGLPLYSSDGAILGEITAVGMYREHKAIEVEISGFLGFGTKTIFVPIELVQVKSDRGELAMTADQVETVMRGALRNNPD